LWSDLFSSEAHLKIEKKETCLTQASLFSLFSSLLLLPVACQLLDTQLP
jgi:hypothetical protein